MGHGYEYKPASEPSEPFEVHRALDATQKATRLGEGSRAMYGVGVRPFNL
jgi:hypothetical protein